MSVGLYKLDSNARVARLGEVRLVDGKVEFSGFDEKWVNRLKKTIEADGQAFLDVMLERYHGDYLWASVEE